MFIIGLTGGLATGKTTVAQMFSDLGAKVLNADQIAHQLIKPKGKCVEKIKKIFGEEVIVHGGVNRSALAKIVFSDNKKLNILENIIHPEVRRTIKLKLKEIRTQRRDSIVVLDVPLLFESKIDQDVDLTIVVKSNRALQIKRAMNNLNISKQDALLRIKSQMPITQKVKLADHVIDNTGRKTETLKKVKTIWQKVLLDQKR